MTYAKFHGSTLLFYVSINISVFSICPKVGHLELGITSIILRGTSKKSEKYPIRNIYTKFHAFMKM